MRWWTTAELRSEAPVVGPPGLIALLERLG
jgi:hypothetical protein